VFESSSEFALFDYFRVPYERSSPPTSPDLPFEVITSPRGTRLMWPTQASLQSGACKSAPHFLRSIPMFGRVVEDADMQKLVRQTGGWWMPADAVRDERGTLVSAVWQTDDGSAFLPFDPNEVISNFWRERYIDLGHPVPIRIRSLTRRFYYTGRPLLPRKLQLVLRRSFSRVQSRTRFPRWPAEPALDDLYRYLLELAAGVAGDPVPHLAVWPKGRSWALVLTHDVEGRTGYENLGRLAQVELDAGYRSSWNFVPENGYEVAPELIDDLRSSGFEIGVHGLHHDGRDVSSPAVLRRRLPLIRAYASLWQAEGFRSPATLRSAKLMPLLGFDYDSSFSDTAPYEPQPGGCCTWLPYMIGDMVELPITLTQDHTLYELLGHRDETHWLEKAQFLRDRGGMALIITHPDYIGNPHLLASYGRFLEAFADDSTAWKALPREVSAWWRRRARSHLAEIDGQWTIVGPAEREGRVELTSPHGVTV
jgi:hypothetical protein